MITIVDYGMGNLGSIRNMFRRIGVRAEITGDPERDRRGAEDSAAWRRRFDAAMREIERQRPTTRVGPQGT